MEITPLSEEDWNMYYSGGVGKIRTEDGENALFLINKICLSTEKLYASRLGSLRNRPAWVPTVFPFTENMISVKGILTRPKLATNNHGLCAFFRHAERQYKKTLVPPNTIVSSFACAEGSQALSITSPSVVHMFLESKHVPLEQAYEQIIKGNSSGASLSDELGIICSKVYKVPLLMHYDKPVGWFLSSTEVKVIPTARRLTAGLVEVGATCIE